MLNKKYSYFWFVFLIFGILYLVLPSVSLLSVGVVEANYFEPPSLIPLPREVSWGEKTFEIDRDCVTIAYYPQEVDPQVVSLAKDFLLRLGIRKVEVVTHIPSSLDSTALFLGFYSSLKLPPGYGKIASLTFNANIEKKLGEEGYLLSVRKFEGQVVLSLFGGGKAGVFYALQTLKQVVVKEKDSLKIREVKIIDYPSFKARGVVEGSYSPPYSHQERLRMIKFMGENKLNFYLYGPKGDPLIRDAWRKLYSPKQVEEFKEEIEEARKNFVTFGYVISPVKAVTYSSDKSFEKLCRKLDQMYDLGIRYFAVFFDDIPYLLSSEDAQHFSSCALAHAYITNKLYAYLKEKDKEVRLAFCPIDYSGIKPTPYLKIIKEELNKGILIGWTGPDICSKEITSEQAKAIAKVIGQAPNLGDNYPVAGTLGLGPLRNRSKDLYKYVESFLSNPLGRFPSASEIPLMTIADYAWNPENYRPDRSYQTALMHFGGQEAYPYLRLFAEQFQTSPCGFEKPSELSLLKEKFWEDYIKGRDFKESLLALRKEFKRCQEAKEELGKSLKREPFLEEMSSYLDKLKDYGEAGEFSLGLLGVLEPPKTEAEREKIKTITDSFLQSRIKLKFVLE